MKKYKSGSETLYNVHSLHPTNTTPAADSHTLRRKATRRVIKLPEEVLLEKLVLKAFPSGD